MEHSKIPVEKLKVTDKGLVIYTSFEKTYPENWTLQQIEQYEKEQKEHRAKYRKEEEEEKKRLGIETPPKFKGKRKPGELSATARRKMMEKVSRMAWKAGAKVVTNNRRFIYNSNKMIFVTLTLPGKQLHTDNEIKHLCLNQFLIELKKKHGVKFYVWKAEKTLSNTIHFHLLIDTKGRFIHYASIREIWNRVINKPGLSYVDRYIARMQRHTEHSYINQYFENKYTNDKRSKAQVRAAYREGIKSGWSNPNTTDVHRIRKAKSIEAYVSKYIGKPTGQKDENDRPVYGPLNEGDKNIQGNLWYCCEDLQGKTPGVEITDRMRNWLYYLETEHNQLFMKINDFCTFVKLSISDQVSMQIYDFYDVFKEQNMNYAKANVLP